MRPKKRKGEPEKLAAVIADTEECEDIQNKRFYGCYLLVSLNPRHKGHTYIGYCEIFSLLALIYVLALDQQSNESVSLVII